MNLQAFVDGIKSDSQTGTIGLNTDQSAIDIIRHLNQAAMEFWEMNNWDWGKTESLITVPASQTAPVSMPSTLGEIISMGVQGFAGELRIFNEIEYRQWQINNFTPPVNSGSGYTTPLSSIYGAVLRGRDASGNIQVLFIAPPLTQTIINVVGKNRLVGSSGFEYAISDITTLGAPGYGYFPNEAMPLLYDWVLGRFLRAIKDIRGDSLLSSVRARLDALNTTTSTQPASMEETPPPDLIRWNNQMRGARSVV